MANYEIFADEAWTHTANPPFRYHCFFGGMLGLSSELDRLDTNLRAISIKYNRTDEVKWSSVSKERLDYYKELVDCFFLYVDTGEVKYRQMFRDRSHVAIIEDGQDIHELDVQFKLCYQFIKHSFGLAFLPVDNSGGQHNLLIRLDEHSSQKHKKELESFVCDLPRLLSRQDLNVRLTFVDSSKFLRIQICDLLMGAAGSYGNKMHLRREPKQRGMNAKQKARLELARYIYNKIRDIDSRSRGSGAFNWFESTGVGSEKANLYNHKIRIWKFKPKRYRVNKGWHNDSLSKHGLWIADNIFPEIISSDDC